MVSFADQSIHEASRAHVTAGSAGQLQHDKVASSDTSQLVASDGAAAAKAEEFVDVSTGYHLAKIVTIPVLFIISFLLSILLSIDLF